MPDSNTFPAVAILPRGALDQVAGLPAGRWLARGNLRPASGHDLLTRVVARLGLSADGLSRAALRYWGDTKTRPEGWVVAADPVFFEARLDHLRLHAMHDEETRSDLAELLEELNVCLSATEDSGRFVEASGNGYLTAGDALFPSATQSSTDIDAQEPGDHMPEGRGAEDYRRLQSEVEMLLHASTVNGKRESAGLRPVNALWFWGGGFAPQTENGFLPPLYGSGSLLAGYWYSVGAAVAPLPERLADAGADAGAVVVLPGDDQLAARLEAMHEWLKSGRVDRLIVLFEGGGDVELHRAHRFRFWRGAALSAALQGPRT